MAEMTLVALAREAAIQFAIAIAAFVGLLAAAYVAGLVVG